MWELEILETGKTNIKPYGAKKTLGIDDDSFSCNGGIFDISRRGTGYSGGETEGISKMSFKLVACKETLGRVECEIKI